MNAFSDREAGEVIARLAAIAEAVNDLRRDLVAIESRMELALQAQRQERMSDLDKIRGELGRRIDDLVLDVKDLSGYRWRLVGFFLASGVAWTVVTGIVGFYIATQTT